VINDPEHTLFNWIASSLAVFLMVATGLAALAARPGNETGESVLESRVWKTLTLLAGVASALMLRFTAILWEVLPKLRFVQFPWRWMSLLSVAFAVLLGAVMVLRRWGWAWAVLAFACIGATGTVLVQRGWWDTQDIPALRAAIANGEGFEGTDEYDPAGDDHTNVPAKAPEAEVIDTDSMPGPNSVPTIHVLRWTPEEKIVTVNSRDPFALGLRLLNYPAWRVEVNGTAVKPMGGEDFRQMIVPLRAGESRVTVRFGRTWDRWVGGALTLVIVLFLLLWRFEDRPRSDKI
jgi:hypothetical protein